MGNMFIPTAIIDGRNTGMDQIVGTFISILKQTVVPPSIKIMADRNTSVDLSTCEDIIKSREGVNVSLVTVISNQIAEVDILRVITSFKNVIGTHKKTNIKKQFPVTHVIYLHGGSIFPRGENNTIQNLYDEWTNGIHYDVQVFSERRGKCPVREKSAIFYLGAVRKLCRFDIWTPFIEKQKIFDKVKEYERDVDYVPIRVCKFGRLESV